MFEIGKKDASKPYSGASANEGMTVKKYEGANGKCPQMTFPLAVLETHNRYLRHDDPMPRIMGPTRDGFSSTAYNFLS